jgi:hypothetical protein
VDPRTQERERAVEPARVERALTAKQREYVEDFGVFLGRFGVPRGAARRADALTDDPVPVLPAALQTQRYGVGITPRVVTCSRFERIRRFGSQERSARPRSERALRR